MTANRELIIARTKPCGCGCHGEDPWHKATYRRVVADVRVIDGTHEEGTVRLPFSTRPVRVTRSGVWSDRFGKVLWLDWVVDRANIVFDK